MRTTRQLLSSLDAALDSRLFSTGLCELIMAMTVNDLLNREESERLEDYLWDHAPLGFKTINAYWWPPREIRPRHKWLRKRIRIEKMKDTLKSIGLWKR